MAASKPSAEQLITENIDVWTSVIKKRGSQGRGSSKKIELYGIKKLRELILELAVRGLLVPQNSNDEPASVLLKKITAEKELLIKDGKLKKQQAQSVPADQEPYSLPPGWEWTYLGELSSNIHYGYTASAQPENLGVRLLRITDIQNDKVNWSTVPGCEITSEKSKSYLLENDDILIARTGGTIGKSYLVENIDVKAVFASYLIRVKRISSMYSPFIKTYLGSSIYWKQLYDNASGTGQPNVNATALKSLLFPIPPEAEQPRIVAKVNELMALCDQLEQQTETSLTAHQTLVETLLNTLLTAAQTTCTKESNSQSNSDQESSFDQAWNRIAQHFDVLFTTEHSIDQLKQTILQLAVMGKLVPQDPSDEPASVLLEKIAAEKEQLIKDKKIKKQKPLPPIGDDGKPFELPVGWEWIRAGEAGDIKLGRQRSPKDHVGPHMVPYLRVANVQDNRIDTSDVKEMNFTPEEQVTFRLEYGDVLLNEGQSKELVGRPAMYRNDVPGSCFQNTLIRFRSYKGVNPEYALLYFRVCLYSGRFQQAVKQTTNMAHLSTSRLIPIEFPLPPEETQKHILTMVDKLMVVCSNLEVHVKGSQQTQLHLADAMAEQALN